MIPETAQKFGYPRTCLFESWDWVVLLRPTQVTFGSLVVVRKGSETSLGATPAAAFSGFPAICAKIENVFKNLFYANKFNYLSLMMVDREVHFHVLPRYANAVSFEGETYGDPFWPNPPNLASALEMSELNFDRLLQILRSVFQETD